jgi:hypothetical protein
MIIILIKITGIIFLILFIQKLKAQLSKWKNVTGFKEEEQKVLGIPFFWGEGIKTIQLSYVNTHLWYNTYCKIKYEIKKW